MKTHAKLKVHTTQYSSIRPSTFSKLVLVLQSLNPWISFL